MQQENMMTIKEIFFQEGKRLDGLKDSTPNALAAMASLAWLYIQVEHQMPILNAGRFSMKNESLPQQVDPVIPIAVAILSIGRAPEQMVDSRKEAYQLFAEFALRFSPIFNPTSFENQQKANEFLSIYETVMNNGFLDDAAKLQMLEATAASIINQDPNLMTNDYYKTGVNFILDVKNVFKPAYMEHSLHLPRKQGDLFRFLAENMNRVVTTEEIQQFLGSQEQSRYHVIINRIKKLIKELKLPYSIERIGVGYQLSHVKEPSDEERILIGTSKSLYDFMSGFQK